MRRISSTLTLLLLSVLFFQCQRELGYVGTPDNIGQLATPDPITAALQGNIFDETGAPATGVTVQVGSKTVTTNSNGYFRINDASLDKKSAVVSASKAGYFKAYRTFGATSGANQVVIKLLKKVVAGTIDAAAGGEVTLSNGSKITLPANAVMNAATSAAYAGSVNVFAAYIDPTASDINQTIPGSFMANDKDGRRVLLTSYGMLAVELEAASGEKLQIKTGSAAKLTTAIPSTAQASAPPSIPLWYVDETTALWKEEGTATKNGNVYVGDVKHFTYWNCDLSGPSIAFTTTLKTTGGLPLVNAYVVIRPAISYGGAAHGYTDSLGQVSGPVPSNMNLILEVRQDGQGGCGNTAIYSQNIGPFTQATDLGIITVTSAANDIITVKGKLVNCSNTPVTSGYVVVNFGYFSRYTRVNATGDFQTTFTRCNNGITSVSIIGIDSINQQQNATAVTVPVVAPLTNAGTVSACGSSATQFINYTLDGVNYSFSSVVANDSLGAFTIRDSTSGNLSHTTAIKGYQLIGNNNIYFEFKTQAQTVGTFPLSYLDVQSFQSTNTILASSNVVLTSFAQVGGQFFEGTFSGSFKDGSNITHTITGTFKVGR